jgi:hypothetical protein
MILRTVLFKCNLFIICSYMTSTFYRPFSRDMTYRTILIRDLCVNLKWQQPS